MGKKILLEHAHIEGIETFDVYRKNGGYEALEKAVKTMTPEAVVEEAKKSGVRGRGGAGFPMGMKWGFLAKPEGVPRHLVCNADESEPGTFKDHYLMKTIPHLLIEGMIISSFALGANKSFIYVRGELMYVIEILQKAIAEAKANGFLGKNILGSGYDLELIVHPGGGAYICGEETALLESLEGKRGNPRNKPPFPAVKGLYQRPTVVNNVESIANMVWVINNGGDAYAAIGVGRSTGTKLISASGHIKNPGVYEIELGLPVEEFMNSDEYCGGIRDGHYLKALVAGGSSVPIIPANLVYKTAEGNDRLMSYESLSDGGFRHRYHAGLGRLHRFRRNRLHRTQYLEFLAILSSRILRAVQPLPRRYRLDGESTAPHRARPRQHARHRPAGRRCEENRRKYHLPARRCRRLARSQRDPPFPRRVRVARYASPSKPHGREQCIWEKQF